MSNDQERDVIPLRRITEIRGAIRDGEDVTPEEREKYRALGYYPPSDPIDDAVELRREIYYHEEHGLPIQCPTCEAEAREGHEH